MKRAPIMEDWSRFNRAVVEIADGHPEPGSPKQSAPQQRKREPVELASGPGENSDSYGLIARHKWRKHA